MKLVQLTIVVWFLAAFNIQGSAPTGSCPAKKRILFGSPETVAAGSTKSITFKSVSLQQNYETECHGEETKKYRTADGSCNNVFNYGAAHTPFRRMLPPAYDDKINAARAYGIDGFPLPTATEVSRRVHKDEDNISVRSIMFMQWGQFIDHDLTLSPVPTETNTALRCCGPNRTIPNFVANKECMPIILSANDTRFKGKCMEFTRSIPAQTASGHLQIPREQINVLTGFLDGSMIYGSSEKHQNELRERTPRGPGDDRVNEHPGLAVIHTVWMRLHNTITRELRRIRRKNRESQEELFQLARKIVIGILQNIHYKEWLPLAVGWDAMKHYNLLPGKRVAYSSHVDPRITNAFSAAAYRFGHSTIPRKFNFSGRLIPLRNLFNRPDEVFNDFYGVLAALVNPERPSQAQEIDKFLVSEITEHLFEPPDQQEGKPSHGLDLAALNIQRGRDHGLPPFNHFRKICGLDPVESFDEFGHDTGKHLADLYRSVEDIDLFPGGMMEQSVEPGRVGPTFACIIAEQFNALKFGDRFYFETDREHEGFTEDQLTGIRKITLAHICCQSKSMQSVQQRVFLAPFLASNPQVECRTLRQEFTDFLQLWATH